MKQHFQQIDVVKGIAIVAVLLLHSLSRANLLHSYAVYHIWQAVPLFMVVMGLNLGLSVHGRTQQLKQLYTRQYFSKKAVRILTPFFIVFLLSVPLGVLWQWATGEDVLAFSWYTAVGVLPVTGKGNYFITLLLQSIVLLPLIGYAFSRRPILTTLVLVLLEVLFQVWAAHFAYFDQNDYLYDAAFPRYFTAIAYGLWLAQLAQRPFRWRYTVLLAALGAVSAFFLWLFTYQQVELPFLRSAWQPQQLLTFGYAAFLVWLALHLLPASSTALALRFLAALGKASYHIFLVQVVYFGLADKQSPLLLNLLTCLVLGYTFYQVEKRLQA